MTTLQNMNSLVRDALDRFQNAQWEDIGSLLAIILASTQNQRPTRRRQEFTWHDITVLEILDACVTSRGILESIDLEPAWVSRLLQVYSKVDATKSSTYSVLNKYMFQRYRGDQHWRAYDITVSNREALVMICADWLARWNSAYAETARIGLFLTAEQIMSQLVSDAMNILTPIEQRILTAHWSTTHPTSRGEVITRSNPADRIRGIIECFFGIYGGRARIFDEHFSITNCSQCRWEILIISQATQKLDEESRLRP